MNTKQERGLSESVQWALVVPTFILCLLALIEGMFWLNARTVVTEAAFAAAEAQAAYGTSALIASDVASRVVLAGGLSDPQVKLSNGAEWINVDVTARSTGLVGWFPATVTAQATRPKERS
ncbi:MAG: pilus assembly protein [Propionibacteriaceae bacterium]|nr:pilus assembly protein [Propionibacteriaceae bacterium]